MQEASGNRRDPDPKPGLFLWTDFLPYMRIRIGFSADTDPEFLVNADPDSVSDPGSWWPIQKKITAAKKYFFISKIAIYLSLSLSKENV